MVRGIATDLDPAPAARCMLPQLERFAARVGALVHVMRPLGIAAVTAGARLARIAAVTELRIGAVTAGRTGKYLHEPLLA
jgi:hypothetical protein